MSKNWNGWRLDWGAGESLRSIGRDLQRAACTLGRECARNRHHDGYVGCVVEGLAQARADGEAPSPRGGIHQLMLERPMEAEERAIPGN